MATFNFATTPAPSTSAQSAALHSLAQPNLVKQLFAGKPAAQTPPVVAASSAVKNQNAPNPFTSNSITNPGASMENAGANNAVNGILGSLSANTTPFNPATQGTFNTTPAPAPTPTLPQPTIVSNLNIPNPPQQTAQVAPATTQTDAISTNNGATAPVAPTAPIAPTQSNAPITPTPTTPEGTPVSYSGLLGATATAAQGETPIEQEEEQIKNNYSNRITGLLPQINSEAGDLTTGTTPVATGNAAIAAQTAAAETGQLQTAEQAALNPLEAEQTAQAAETTGLQGAATSAAPTGNFPFVFNPTTGSYSVSGGDLQGAISGGVQQAVSNPALYSALNDAITSTYGSAAAGMFQQAYIAAGGNPTTATAQGTTAAQNTITAGTTPTATAAAGYSTTLQNYNTANAAYQTITGNGTSQGLAAQVQGILASSGINSSNSQDWNSAINSLSSRLGSENQAAYIAGLSELQQSYTNLLSSVGAATPTVNGQQALAIFNPASTPAQIDAAISALNNAAYSKLSPMYTQVQQYQSALQSGSGSSGTSGSGANTITVGQYSFSKNAQGQWVAN